MFPGNHSAQKKQVSTHRVVACLIALLLAATWLCEPTALTHAQDTLLYEQNFDSSSFPDGWNITSIDGGSWWVDNGQLVGSGHAFAEYRPAGWSPGSYSLEFDLAWLNVGGGLHINVQHSDIGRYLIGLRRVDETHMYIYIERNLWDQPSEPLADNNDSLADYSPDRNYRVLVTYGDGQISVTLIKSSMLGSGAIALPDVMAQDSQPLPPGGISFESLEETDAQVDNLVVYGPRMATQPPAAPNPQSKGPSFGECPGEVLQYAEDFNDNMAQDWNLEDSWSIGDGMMQASDHYWASYQSLNWGNNTLYSVFGLREGMEGVNFSLRAGEAGRYFVYVTQNVIGIERQLGWDDGAQYVSLAEQQISLDTNQWHTLGFGVHGGTILVSLDGVDLLKVQDDPSLPAGALALEVHSGGFVLVDSIWICGEPPVPPNPPSNPMPDLTIQSIQEQSYDPATRSLVLRIAVLNAGNAPSAPNQISVQEQDATGEEYFFPLAEVGPGAQGEVYAQIPVRQELAGGSTRYDVGADARQEVPESNEDNNVLLSEWIAFPAPAEPAGPVGPAGPSGPTDRPSGVDSECIIGAILLVGFVITVWVIRRLVRRSQKGPGHKPPKPEPQEIPPVLPPPVRLLNLWLTEGSSGQGPRIKDDQPLVAGKDYCLHAQVLSAVTQANVPRPATAVVPIQAVVFSPRTSFMMERRRLVMNLPADGSSQVVIWPFRANEPGYRRARVCLYYGNLLLQSGYVDAEVISPKGRRIDDRYPALRRMLDYVNSASLTTLDQFPQPNLSIFTNQAGGSSWIGVYAAGDPITGFGDGLLRQVDAERITSRAKVTRQRLLEIEQTLQYTSEIRDGRSRAQQINQLERDLAALACNGWTLYDDLFLQSGGASKTEKVRFDLALRSPGLIAVDRCHSEKATLPWAAIYDLEVDTGKEDLLHLCPVFRSELESHWPEDMSRFQPHLDWLDNPDGCRQNPRCPLNGKDNLLTICPLAFWGFRHQISQPLQAVTPTPFGQVPEEIANAGEEGGVSSFDSTIFLRRKRDQKVNMAIGVHPGLSQANRLPVDLSALCPNDIQVTFESTRDRVLELLKQGGYHFYILYCHGDRDEREQKFKLVFGPLNDERSISCDNLNPMKINWPEQPKPLVILNGCDTVAVTPEMVHGLLDRMHELGASGVIGTEIQVYPNLAYPFGLEIVERLLFGDSLGQAFLRERKELLRKFNPLGLAYTYHAPAALHIHMEGTCGWCSAHGVTQVKATPVQAHG